MTLQEFQSEYRRFVTNYDRNEVSLSENPQAQDLCLEMIRDAFPSCPNSEKIIEGFMSMYYNAAIAATYDGLCFSLETDWFEIGLDKCAIFKNPEEIFNVTFAVQVTHGKYPSVYHARIIYNKEKTHLLVDAGSNYKKLLVKGLDNFNQLIEKIKLSHHSWTVQFNGMELDFDGIEFLLDGFCGVNRETPLQALNLLPNEIPNDDYFHYGNFSYDEKNNTCVSDNDGLPLKIKKELVVKMIPEIYSFRLKIGSKPYLTGDSNYDCTCYGFYEDKMFSGTSTELDDWAANL